MPVRSFPLRKTLLLLGLLIFYGLVSTPISTIQDPKSNEKCLPTCILGYKVWETISTAFFTASTNRLFAITKISVELVMEKFPKQTVRLLTTKAFRCSRISRDMPPLFRLLLRRSSSWIISQIVLDRGRRCRVVRKYMAFSEVTGTVVQDRHSRPFHRVNQPRSTPLLLECQARLLATPRLPVPRLHSHIHLAAMLLLQATLQADTHSTIRHPLLRFRITVPLVVMHHLRVALPSRDLHHTMRRLDLHQHFRHHRDKDILHQVGIISTPEEDGKVISGRTRHSRAIEFKKIVDIVFHIVRQQCI